MGMTRIVVHIDRLLLKGFGHSDRHAIAGGLRQELGRLLAAPGAAPHAASITDAAHRKAKSVPIGWGAQPPAIGAAAARSIVRELKS
jgi:hypothetical protein